MTKRDFFRAILKIFGVYLLITTLFTVLPSYISYLSYEFDFLYITSLLSAVIIPGLILAALLFRTDEIIDLLKLDKGFDEGKIAFENLKSDSVLKLAVITIGLFMVVSNSPTFLHHTFLAFKDMVTNKGVDGVLETHIYGKVDYAQIVTSIISLIIGFLMITNFTNLAKWLAKANKKNS
jgi:hypothetical protein